MIKQNYTLMDKEYPTFIYLNDNRVTTSPEEAHNPCCPYILTTISTKNKYKLGWGEVLEPVTETPLVYVGFPDLGLEDHMDIMPYVNLDRNIDVKELLHSMRKLIKCHIPSSTSTINKVRVYLNELDRSQFHLRVQLLTLYTQMQIYHRQGNADTIVNLLFRYSPETNWKYTVDPVEILAYQGAPVVTKRVSYDALVRGRVVPCYHDCSHDAGQSYIAYFSPDYVYRRAELIDEEY